VNGKVLEELHNVVVDSFAEDEFKRLLAFKLGQEPKRWVGDAAGLDRLVEVTLDKARREGWLRRLVEVVSEARSDRPDVQKACDDVAVAFTRAGVDASASMPKRHALVRDLSRLAPPDWEFLVTVLEGAAARVSRHGTVPEQAAELIRWAESPTGPGLAAVEEAFKTLQNP
jgi:hypothetical protein